MLREALAPLGISVVTERMGLCMMEFMQALLESNPVGIGIKTLYLFQSHFLLHRVQSNSSTFLCKSPTDSDAKED